MTAKLYVGNLPKSATKTALETKFSQFGRVLSVDIATEEDTRRSTRSGFVEMETSDQAQSAMDRLNMTQYDDVVISVNRVRQKHGA
jgi:RNA recognition motif-containing protein